jgi:hypothetical protein
MRIVGLAIGAACVFASQAAAADARFEKSLQMLAPAERLEQLCDYTAMVEIRKDAGNFRPDRALSSAVSEPVAIQDSLEAKGAAFRSRGKWYALSYSCAATPDHMAVVTFKYTVGPEIPEAKWAGYGLWN